MIVRLTHLCVNSCFISKVHFDYGKMDMTNAQDKELRRKYEKSLARKLRLGSNFPIKMLHGRVTAMGVLTLAPKTAIVALTLKLYFSHKIMNSEILKMLKIMENNSTIEMGSKGGSSGENKTNELGSRL